MFLYNGRRYGFEVKFSEAPELTPSMKIAIESLGLSKLWIVYPGQQNYPVDENIAICSLQKIGELSL
jgi:hypothetical protein